MKCMPGSEWQNFQNPAARASLLWTTSCRPGALGPTHRDARTHSVRLGLIEHGNLFQTGMYFS